jgi:hypothetical protein
MDWFDIGVRLLENRWLRKLFPGETSANLRMRVGEVASFSGRFSDTAAFHHQPIPDHVCNLWRLKKKTLTPGRVVKKELMVYKIN